jgi:amino acid adenylation domain-containing protein
MSISADYSDSGLGVPDMRAPLGRAWQGSLVDRFKSHAPQQVAIETEYESWTYGEVGLVTEELSRGLLRFRSKAGDVVAIYAAREASLVVALLGVIRAGLGFVILDPAYPPARTVQCLSLARPVGLINLAGEEAVPAEVSAAIKQHPGAFLWTLPKGKKALMSARFADNGNGALWPDDSGPDAVLYFAFTSGSTGIPKGIVGHHSPVTHFFAWQQRQFGLSSSDRVSVLSGLAHDPLLRDVLMPLWVGGTVCMPPQSCYELPNRLFEWMRDSGITLAHLTPSLGNLLLASSKKSQGGGLESLKYAFFGGEMLKYSLVRRLREFAPRATIVNCYGATETPQVVGFHVVTDREVREASSDNELGTMVPIGKGIADAQLLVLNTAEEPCPPGEQGQICIRTPYLAQRVLGPDGNPISVFKPNPNTSESWDLIYPTGDYGFYRPDGSVVCTGRRDRQIKVRGHRIQLEEIDSVLAAQDCIRQHHVEVEGWDSDAPVIVVYVVPDEACQLGSQEVRETLSRQLPEFMVPGRVVIVDEMPLTPNGKIDVAALRSPGKKQPAVGAVDAPDRHRDFEPRLLQIFAEQTGNELLSREDDLIRAGLNSLQAINVCCAIEEEFERTLSVQDLVASRTVQGVALHLSKPSTRGSAEASRNAPLEAAIREGPGGSKNKNCGDLIPRNENLLVGIKNRVFQIIARVAPDVWRVRLHKLRGVSIGEDVSIGYDTIVETSYPWLVRIGNRVNIGMRVTILAHFRGMTCKDGGVSVEIQDEAFIGPQVVILPNVTIGRGAVITAGSVVNSSIPPFVLSHGNPAVPVAKCGVALSGETQYADFLKRLLPL